MDIKTLPLHGRMIKFKPLVYHKTCPKGAHQHRFLSPLASCAATTQVAKVHVANNVVDVAQLAEL
jgi:hypothetical protein